MGFIMQLIAAGIDEYQKKKAQRLKEEAQKKRETTRVEHWITPKVETYKEVGEWLSAPHLLIAGATGSGKSVLIKLLIHDIIAQAPFDAQMILIDPKRVELVQYKDLPHTKDYASEPDEIISSIDYAIDIMEWRYKRMQNAGQRETKDGHLYVIIDEYADLMLTNRKQTESKILRLAQLGRAAHVHLIVATQRTTADIINGAIKVNIDHRFALHCPTARDSRNIIEQKGAETLPMYGQAIYYSPHGLKKYNIPMVEDAEMDRLIDWWSRQDGTDYNEITASWAD